MFSQTIFVENIVNFYSFLNNLFQYLMTETANQTKYCTHNFTKCFVSNMGEPDHYHKRLSTCPSVPFF